MSQLQSDPGHEKPARQTTSVSTADLPTHHSRNGNRPRVALQRRQETRTPRFAKEEIPGDASGSNRCTVGAVGEANKQRGVCVGAEGCSVWVTAGDEGPGGDSQRDGRDRERGEVNGGDG